MRLRTAAVIGITLGVLTPLPIHQRLSYNTVDCDNANGNLKRCTIEADESATSAQKVRTAIVPEWQWIDVVPESSVQAEDTTCGIDYGGMLTFIGANGDQYLVRYETPKGPQPGTPCPSGVVFFIPASEFNSMTSRYHNLLKHQTQEHLIVQRLLKEDKNN